MAARLAGGRFSSVLRGVSWGETRTFFAFLRVLVAVWGFLGGFWELLRSRPFAAL
ncbi:hypothetical protein VDG1235_4028 [Verrucomicrobiia bacterium DG1235]|nr:hypothetical protein VDG1235_4028 [Verrucomicrobiae bacterium DG1235]